MKRAMLFGGVVILAMALLFVSNPAASAGRLGGPLNTAAIAPAGQSMFFNIPFAAGAEAIVTVTGEGNSVLDVMLYDSDGHMGVGAGSADRKTVMMNVYRTGMFRLEVRNHGPVNDHFTLTTN